MRRLLTPAPTHHGQLAHHRDGTLWEADYNQHGRLSWRRIPLWRIDKHINHRARAYLGQHILAVHDIPHPLMRGQR